MVSRSQKREGNICSPRSHQKNQPCWHLNFSLMRLISDLGLPELEENERVLSEPLSLWSPVTAAIGNLQASSFKPPRTPHGLGLFHHHLVFLWHLNLETFPCGTSGQAFGVSKESLASIYSEKPTLREAKGFFPGLPSTLVEENGGLLCSLLPHSWLCMAHRLWAG